jgi:hypothetical protein
MEPGTPRMDVELLVVEHKYSAHLVQNSWPQPIKICSYIGYISRVKRCIMSQFAGTFCSYRAFHLQAYDAWILTCGGGRSLSPSALTAKYKKTVEFSTAYKKTKKRKTWQLYLFLWTSKFDVGDNK